MRNARPVAGTVPSAAGPGLAGIAFPHIVAVLLFGLFAVVLARTAWVSDDAYISFRSADNLVHGHGLRWNVAERVQAFTNPLWTLVVAALHAATPADNMYGLAIGLSLPLSLAVAGLVAWRWSRDPLAGAPAIALMLSSRAIVDYSSSGLENPLIHLLLVAFFRPHRPGDPGAAGGRAQAARDRPAEPRRP